MVALARVNWLHSRYKIVLHSELLNTICLLTNVRQSNDDYLYTLSIFVLEPAVCVLRYHFSRLTGFIFSPRSGQSCMAGDHFRP